jgi:hypothetical protein
MYIYKYFEIENFHSIQSKIKEYILEKTDVMQRKIFWRFLDTESLLKSVPELSLYFQKFDLRITTTAAIYRRPYSQGGIHIDTSEFFRVLIPVLNCQGSRTKFFELDSSKFQEGGGVDGDRNLTLIPGQRLNFIDEFELSKPVIFNPKIPHGVYCNLKSNEPRVSLTLGFDKDPKNIF